MVPSFQRNEMFDRQDNSNLYDKVAMVLDNVTVTQQVISCVHLNSVHIKKLTLKAFPLIGCDCICDVTLIFAVSVCIAPLTIVVPISDVAIPNTIA